MKTLIITLLDEDDRREVVNTLFSNETHKIKDCEAVLRFKHAQFMDADWVEYDRQKEKDMPWRGKRRGQEKRKRVDSTGSKEPR